MAITEKTSPTSGLFFDKRDHVLISMVNKMLEGELTLAGAQRHFFHYLHPRGIKELSESQGLRIAYAVIHLLESLESGHIDHRLRALSALRDEVLCGSDKGMRKNTARVLIEIMKDLVRARGDPDRQIVLAHDFRLVASGKHRIVRKYLKQYHLLEMPEAWNQLAFDDHVHDANTKGRKSATHLIMDAWVKGIRRLRVIYYNFIRPEGAEEILKAAAIMGITVRLGIEFSVSFYDRFPQIIWVPRGFVDAEDFLKFLGKETVRAFMDEGRAVSDYQQNYVLSILDAFNDRHRKTLCQELGIDFSPVDREEFYGFVGMGQASLLHLSKFIHMRLLPLMRQKASGLRTKYISADTAAKEEIRALIQKMDRLDQEAIHSRFLVPERNPEVPDIKRSCSITPIPVLMQLSPCGLIDRLAALHSGYRVTLNLTDLSVEDVLEMLYECRGRISRLEIFNLKDYSDNKTGSIPLIHRLQQCLNSNNVIRLKRLITEIIDNMETSDNPVTTSRVPKIKTMLSDIETLRNMYRIKALKPRVGSDSTGYSPSHYGMGLAVIDSLPKDAQRRVMQQAGKTRLILPFEVDTRLRVTYAMPDCKNTWYGGLVRKIASIPFLRPLVMRSSSEWIPNVDSTRMVAQGNLVTLGGREKEAGNSIHLEADAPVSGRKRLTFAYLHSPLKNILKVAVGFVPAYLTFLWTHDWWVLMYFGAFIWFFITGFRNIVQSVVGAGGLKRSTLRKWNELVSWDRLSDSLLFTGFSVPLLDLLVKTVILDHGFGINIMTRPILLYTLMAMANGIYLTSHNIFRGLPREAAYANFFRSVLSIPVAFGFNEVAGGLLAFGGVPGIDAILQSWAAVISKGASDLVAGFIEGSVDRFANVENRINDYRQKLAQLFDAFTRLEILFPEKDVGQLLDAPEKWFAAAGKEAREPITVLIINALDMLYFWMYQPRARTAFKQLVKTMEPDERQILIKTQSVLKMKKEVSQLFIDGIVGTDFSRPLAFYLSRSGEYLKAIEKMTEGEKYLAPSGEGGL
ncbi:MAG: hypothetical protein GXP53_04765 [Deltaproteobacteria bacterium]|nr:hypothetical protein [Deltaproteobacteria bacterium]